MQRENPFPHVRRALAERPWAILPSVHAAMVEVVERRCAGRDMTAEERERYEAARRTARPQAAPGAVAVIPVHGILAQRMDLFMETSGGTSYEGLAEQLAAALAAPGVSTILLDVDSPGGEVHGLEEFAALVAKARQVKPVVAIANTLAASAAYFIASQADELVVSPSAEVGSIGVIMMHDDYSKFLEREGIARTYVTSSPFKAEFNPTTPLSQDSKDYAQAMVDRYHGVFVQAVASGRKVARKRVEEDFGKGRTVTAERAFELGMADRVESFADLVGRLQKRAADAAKTRRAEVEREVLAIELA